MRPHCTGISLITRRCRPGAGTRRRPALLNAGHARLAAQGVEVLKPPTSQPWGRRSVWLRDPDGNIVNLYQEV
ncbi:VOC family protein [Streptomyces sp. NPDC003015]